MNENILLCGAEETVDDYLYRLGTMKNCGIMDLTWTQIADLINKHIAKYHSPMDESSYRKRFQRLQFDRSANKEDPSIFARINNANSIVDARDQETLTDNHDTIKEPEPQPAVDEKMLIGEKLKVKIRDERTALNRTIRNEARRDVILDLFNSTIQRYQAPAVIQRRLQNHRTRRETPVAIYALLSDIHYGIAYDTTAGKYNSEIAERRVMQYADEICAVGNRWQAGECYVSLMGDMISGNIHNVIRIENRENVVEQVVGVSELVAAFLYRLCETFNVVHVNSVSGNHSRIVTSPEDALRGECLDALIPWYCKTKLENCDGLIWHDNDIDTSISDFTIFGVHYVSVHGDMDANLQKSTLQIERIMHDTIDYIVAGHMHVPELRLESTGYVRNGSVCGSGDEYTMKKRLFGYPCQICMVVDETGVRDYVPVALM